MKIEHYWFGFVVVDSKTGIAMSKAYKLEHEAQNFIHDFDSFRHQRINSPQGKIISEAITNNYFEKLCK